MIINFTKMHGLGNDFVIIDQITQHTKLYTAHFQSIADRHFGVGCDQVLLVEPPITEDADFSYRIFNTDGSAAEQCGNGIRCVAKFVYDSGLVNKQHLVANSKAGKVFCSIKDHNRVSVELPVVSSIVGNINVTASSKQFDIAKISMGNPHGIIICDNLDDLDAEFLGKEITNNLPEPLNISFMQIIDRDNIKLKVYERGVGVTLSCGTAAAAASLVGINSDILNEKVCVNFVAGNLSVFFNKQKQTVTQTGATATVFFGKFRL